jgi:hypothetical protein
MLSQEDPLTYHDLLPNPEATPFTRVDCQGRVQPST